jgi:hypothetical protein
MVIRWTARPILTAAAIALIGAFAPPQCLAAKTVDSFEAVVRDAAEAILAITKNQPVFVGHFAPRGKELVDSNSGPAIGELLKKAIESLKPGIVRRDAPFEVDGHYLLTTNPERPALKAIQINFKIVDRDTGKELPGTIDRFVDDNTSIARLLNVSGPISNDPGKLESKDRLDRNKELVALAKNPKSFVDPKAPTLIRSAQGKPFAIEVLSKPLAAPESQAASALAATIDPASKLAFVKLDQGDLYEIRVHNESPHEMAVQVFIDGLDIFHFSDDRDPADSSKPKFSHLVIPAQGKPGSTQSIVGWHKSVENKRFDSFLVTAYGKGAASKAGIPATGPIGVIQVQFSRSLLPLPPGLEGQSRKRSTRNETGFGPPRSVEQKPVEREIEPPIDAITVRYNR